MAEITPLYTEEQAAAALGIKSRSLRTERESGRIGFKRVAGKIMYRHDDIEAWQGEGERCQEGGQTKGQKSSRSKNEDGTKLSSTSDGAKLGEAGSVQRARAIAEKLKHSSVRGSSSAPPVRRDRSAPVIPLRPE